MADSLIVFGGGKIFRVNPNTFEATLLGSLASSSVGGPGGVTGLAIDEDQRLYGLHETDGIWRLNPWNPQTTTSPYGKISDYRSDMLVDSGTIQGATFWNQDLWVVRTKSTGDAELWRLNAEDPASRIRPFGKVGDLTPSIGSQVRSIASDGTNFLIPAFGAGIYRIDPADSDSTTGAFGLQRNSSNATVNLPIGNTKGAAYANGYLYILGKDDSLYQCKILDDYRTTSLTVVENTPLRRYPQLRGRSNAMTFGELPDQISWMTVGQVEEQISELRQAPVFNSKTADEKYTFINFATSRLEGIPFKDNYFAPRFVDGFKTNNLGDASNEPMPDKLKWAFTLYCESLAEFGSAETFPAISGTSLPVDDVGGEDVVLSSLMMGIPMSVQSLLFEFVNPVALRETYRPSEDISVEATIRGRAVKLEIS